MNKIYNLKEIFTFKNMYTQTAFGANSFSQESADKCKNTADWCIKPTDVSKEEADWCQEAAI